MQRIDHVKGIELVEVEQYIEDQIEISTDISIPVFRLKDIYDLFRQRMLFHGACLEETETIHRTRLKEQVLKDIPCLIESKCGSSVLLTLDKEIGRALFEACKKTSRDEGIILAKAASIIRKRLLDYHNTFNGDISKN